MKAKYPDWVLKHKKKGTAIHNVMLYLSRVRKLKMGEKWNDLEIPKQAKSLIEKLEIPIT